MRYEIRFYDALNQVKVSIELTSADRHAAEMAARDYILHSAAVSLAEWRLVLGVVKELS